MPVSRLPYSSLTACFYHAKCTFHTESTLYNCLNVKEFIPRNRCHIWSLCDCNRTRTHNHLDRKRTLKPFSHLSKWLSVYLRTKWLWVRVLLQSLIGSFFRRLNSKVIKLNSRVDIYWKCRKYPPGRLFFSIEDLSLYLMKFTAFVSTRPTFIFEMIKTNMPDGRVHQIWLWKKMITENLWCVTNALKLPELISES